LFTTVVEAEKIPNKEPYTTLEEMLFAVVVLPIVLPEIVLVNVPFMLIPRKLSVPDEELKAAIPPIVLFKILIDPSNKPDVPVPALIPENTASVECVDCVKVTLLVEDWLPSVLPVTLILPVTAEIKDCADEELEVVIAIF